MELTRTVLLQAWQEEGIYDENDNLLYETAEEGEWMDSHKYQHKQVVVKEIATGKHFAFEISRSGSYFSHYEYDVWDDAVEVKKVKKLVEVESWVQV